MQQLCRLYVNSDAIKTEFCLISRGPMASENLFGEEQTPSMRRRKKKKSSLPVFKPYEKDQLMALPASLEELIAPTHMVRVVDKTIDGLDIDALIASYKGGGTSSYHPKMLVKVLVYAYLSKLYSSRMIAKALREDINFMWLSGQQRPDFRTLNRFRSSRLKETIDSVFGSMISFCLEKKYISFTHYFVDGTKIEASANRSTYIWAKNTSRYKAAVQQKIKEHLRHIEEINRQENLEYGDADLEELGESSTITSEALKEQINKLNTLIAPSSKKQQSAIKKITKDCLPKLEHYEAQENILGDRSSYSKTDIDATFFRLKTGELRPAYNVFIGTENQFIVNYSFHRKASESDHFIPHVKKLLSTYGIVPDDIIGDAAYGSEENYAFSYQHEITPYLRYNTQRFEKSKKYREAHYHKDKFVRDKNTDTYQCPQGKTLRLHKEQDQQTSNGYLQHMKIYRCENCADCPVKPLCTKSAGNRTIQILPQLEIYRQQARELLSSPQGRTLSAQRGVEPESAFGDLKWNQHFTRFILRGKEKVNIEFGLVSMAHNIKKISKLVN
jgi:transposase